MRSKFWPSPSLAYQHRADMVQILPQPISNPPNSRIFCSRCSKMFQRESFAYDHQPPYPTRAWNISRKVFQMFQNAYQIDTSSGSRSKFSGYTFQIAQDTRFNQAHVGTEGAFGALASAASVAFQGLCTAVPTCACTLGASPAQRQR